MTTREQDTAIDAICLANGGQTHVRHGYKDRHVEVTTPRGQCWAVSEDGIPTRLAPDFSVRWS